MQTDLLVAQAGTQSVFQTAVTPTVKLMQMKSLEIEAAADVQVPKTILSNLGPGDTPVTLGADAKFRFEQYALYEDINYWLENIYGTATPSGAGPYTRDSTSPLTTAPTNRILTLLKGGAGSNQAVRLTGGLLNELTIKGGARQFVMVSGSGVGKVADINTLASLSNRSVNHVLGRHAALYVDAAGGTIGTTAVTATNFEYEFKIKAPRTPLPYIGESTANDFSPEAYDYSLKLHLEWNATSAAYVTEYLSATTPHQRQIRIVHDDTANRQLRIDFAGANDGKVKFWASRNGRATLDATYVGVYNAALAAYNKIRTINSVSALP